MLRKAKRICEHCGTERRISMIEESVVTLAGETVTGLFGEGRCLCDNRALSELDLKALEAARQP